MIDMSVDNKKFKLNNYNNYHLSGLLYINTSVKV